VLEHTYVTACDTWSTGACHAVAARARGKQRVVTWKGSRIIEKRPYSPPFPQLEIQP